MSIVSIQIDYTFLAIITITKNKLYLMKTNVYFIYIESFNTYLKSITDLLINWKLCIISLCIIIFYFCRKQFKLLILILFR